MYPELMNEYGLRLQAREGVMYLPSRCVG